MQLQRKSGVFVVDLVPSERAARLRGWRGQCCRQSLTKDSADYDMAALRATRLMRACVIRGQITKAKQTNGHCQAWRNLHCS